MKSLLSLLLLFVPLLVQAADLPPAPSLQARSWLLLDMQSGQTLVEKDADSRLEPASLTKLMTAYLSFAAIRDGRLKLDQALNVSEQAWRAEGSRMFLDPRQPAKVEALLKGMIVQSGNDACIVLAEAIAGSEEQFAALMNQAAQRLGMGNSHFVNATGLPHAEHYSTARDMATLSAALIREFPEFYKLYALRDYRYNGISQPNRNRLLYTDPTVDGVKTGHTDKAGYCLVASAQRESRRLLSVVLGADSDQGRAAESQKLLNFGFMHYQTVRLYPANQAVAQIRLFRGAENALRAGFLTDFYVSVPRGQAGQIRGQIITSQPMLAPVRRGQKVGSLRVYAGDRTLAEFPVVALHSVDVAGILKRGWDNILLLFK
jgi:D-alanyl-D-alanine carboxypeptidase (penicillin-binding protein 5/6)